MIGYEEYRQMDGIGLAELIKKGNISAAEVLECAITRAEQVNPKINAIIAPMYDHSRKYLLKHSCGGMFSGVPVLLKDLLGELKGKHTGSGTSAHKGEPAECTSSLFQRMSAMGMVFIGKTNTPEFGLLATTEPKANGPTRNPWNLKKTAGGSSGGSAAAVAAGITPIASAGDGGGSIRIPASCCGLFGLKPTRGINPMGPCAESWDGAVCEHVITRTVRDSLEVLKGTVGSDSFSHVPIKLPNDFFINAENPLDRTLKIGYCRYSFYGGVLHDDCESAVLAAVDQLKSLGHVVEEARLDLDADKLIACYSDIYAANVNADISELVARYGKAFVRSNIEPLTYFIYNVGKHFSAGDYILSKRRWAELSSYMNSWHQQFDVLLTPTMAVPPFDLKTMTNNPLESFLMQASNHMGLSKYASRELLYTFSKPQLNKVPFTQLANLTGQPAMSVPLYWNADNLPIGVQFMADRLQDPILFRLARQLEITNPWFERLPLI